MSAPKAKSEKRISSKAIALAFAKSGGVYSIAAKALQCSPRTLRRRVAAEKDLRELRDEIIDTTLDLAESKLIALVKRGNLGAICFYLKHKGKDRGYSERHEVVGVDGSSPVVHFYMPKKDALPAENEAVPELADSATSAPPSTEAMQ